MLFRQVPCLLWISTLFVFYTVDGVSNTCIIVLTSYGTPYENGYCIGKQFATQIDEIINGYDYYVNRTVPWTSTTNGQTQFNIFKDTIQIALDSRFDEELQGLADGSGKTYNQILLLNMEAEVRSFLGDSPTTFFGTENYTMYTGSADYLFKTADSETFYVHQHDLDSIFHKKIFILDATYVRPVTGVEIESFISVMAPGILPGMMFASNRQQLAYSINPMFPVDYFRGGGVGCRDVLKLAAEHTVNGFRRTVTCPMNSSTKTGVGILLNYTKYCEAFNILMRSLLNDSSPNFLLALNAWGATPPTGPSITTWNQTSSSINGYEVYMNFSGIQQTGFDEGISDNYYFHFNEYQHIQPPITSAEKFVTMSTLYRSMFMGNWVNNNGVLANKNAVKELISNQDYPAYPIYADPNDGNRIGTMFTTILYTSGGSNFLEVYLDKPSTTNPQYRLNLTSYWSDTDYIP